MTLTQTHPEPAVAAPAPGRYVLDTDRTIVEVAVRHFAVAQVRGRFRALGGRLTVAKRAEDSWLRVDLDAASLATGHRERDASLQGAAMLASSEFPVIRLETAGVVARDGSTYDVVADLYIRDAVVETTARVWLVDFGDDHIRLAARLAVSRSSLGLGWSSEVERYGVLVADTVRVTVGAEFRR
ncbi:MAG TPA: YceI family protein [Acidimicrobiales bacterium]